MIDVYPRYAELLALRGDAAGRRPARRRRRSRPTTCATCRSGRSSPGSIPSISTATRGSRRLRRQGPRTSPRTTRRLLRTVELELLNGVIPEYRDAAARGPDRDLPRRRSTTRFCRCCATPTSTCGRTRDSPMPRQRFQHPEDAAEQLERAVACHERLFGRRPVGLWPSEGSVSDAMVPLVAQGRLHVDGDRRADSRADARHDLHAGRSRPRRAAGAALSRRTTSARAARRSPACSATTSLSDLIGFVYAAGIRTPPPTTSSAGSSEAGRRYRGRPAGERRSSPSSSTARTPGSTSKAAAGRFCARCTGRLSGHPELRTVTMAEACASPARDAARASSPARGSTPTSTSGSATPTTSGPGASWPRRARRSRRPRDAPAPARRAGPRGDAHRRRQRLVLVVRRRPLVGARPGVRRPVPAAPAERLPAAAASRCPTSCSSATSRRRRGASRTTSRPRRALADPRRRGDELLRMAGRRHVRGPRRRRAPCTRPARRRASSTLRAVRVRARRTSSSASTASAGWSDLLADGHEFSLTFLHRGVRFGQQRLGGSRAVLGRGDAGRGAERSPGRRGGGRHRPRAGAVPLQDLEARAGDAVAFFVSASLPAVRTPEAERHPAQRPIQVDVPGRAVRARDNWRA